MYFFSWSADHLFIFKTVRKKNPENHCTEVKCGRPFPPFLQLESCMSGLQWIDYLYKLKHDAHISLGIICRTFPLSRALHLYAIAYNCWRNNQSTCMTLHLGPTHDTNIIKTHRFLFKRDWNKLTLFTKWSTRLTSVFWNNPQNLALIKSLLHLYEKPHRYF